MKNLDVLVVLSLGFFVQFCASNVAQSLATTLLANSEYKQYSFISLSLLYFSFMISGFAVAPTLVKRWGAKSSIVFASIFYAVYNSVFVLPIMRSEKISEGQSIDEWYLGYNFVFACIMIAPLLNGIGAGILWVSQGNLISLAASEKNKGFFNGFFQVFFQISMLGGPFFFASIS